MLTFDSVKLRLDREQSLSYMEFNYMIFKLMIFINLKKTKMYYCNWVDQINGVILLMELN